jgi:hypothetical protein
VIEKRTLFEFVDVEIHLSFADLRGNYASDKEISL